MFANCCLLATIVLLQTNSPFSDPSETVWQANSIDPAPNAGLLVTIDPELLIGKALGQAWRNIDEPFDKYHVQSKPLSKVNFQLNPVPSDDGAVIDVTLDGSSVGSTTSSTQKTEIRSDSLTRFRAKLNILFHINGLAFSQPKLKVKTNQSFNSANTKKGAGFGAMFAKVAYRRFPEQVESRAKTFACRQLVRHIQATFLNLERTVYETVARLSQTRPALTGLGWHIFSDNRNVYLAVLDSSGNSNSTTPPPQAPIVISATNSFVEEFARQNIGGKNFTDRQLDSFRKKFLQSSSQVETNENTKSSSIEFPEDPLEVTFEDNRMNLKLAIANFEIEEKQLRDIILRADYEVENSNGKWELKRAGELIVESNQSGARQQIVRTVVRKRAAQFLPNRIELPILKPTKSMKQMDLDLMIEQIIARDEKIFVTINHRR